MDNKQKYSFSDLVNVMRALRTPDTGCPWDLEQDFKSILPYTLEEAYEVADAIDRDDMNDLCEELGDLLFQSVYHAQMASEVDSFDINDVVHDITRKMITRHPHVFDSENANSADDVNEIWDRQKAIEKQDANQSALDGVTQSLPALLKAQKLQKKAAKVGFQWDDIRHVLDKLDEEITEMRAAIDANDLKNQEEELGDILFLLTNYGRMLGINSEEALRKCNNKFERRFRGLEEEITSTGKLLSDVDLKVMEQAWNNQKTKEKES